MALYNATDGPNWADTTNWLSDAPLSEWYGVRTDSMGRVTGLNLRENDLIGEIPPELGNLFNLTYLGLSGNRLIGEIPSEMGELSNLQVLGLNENDLSGPIPSELGNLSNLTYLGLFSNRLSGEIPSELGNLSKLTHLVLTSNQLSGEVPPELGRLSNLEELWLNHNRFSGEIPLELANLSLLHIIRISGGNEWKGCIPLFVLSVRLEDGEDSGIPFCTYAVETDPPTWIFVGDIQEEHQTLLRQEMESVRGYFSEQFGVEATGFTVLVAADHESLIPEFRGVVGRDLLGGYVPPGYSDPSSLLPDPFVTTADDGTPVMVLIYARNPFESLLHAIAHEYFHVLQSQLIASKHHLSEVEPYWLVEGTAMYADHAYSQSRSGRRPFLGDRYTPYEDLADAIEQKRIITARYLSDVASESTFRDGCEVHPIYVYSIAFAGAYLLVEKAGEDSFVEFWKLLQQRPTWQQAFEEAFGMGIEDYYDLFEEWLPDQLPSYVDLSVWLNWPGKESLPRDILGPLVWKIEIAPEDYEWPSPIWGWGGITNGAHTITSVAGETWTGKLALWFKTDECTQNLLGWYKDGELTDQRTEATVVEFSGEPSSLDWTLSARPDTLPSLESRTLSHCQ